MWKILNYREEIAEEDKRFKKIFLKRWNILVYTISAGNNGEKVMKKFTMLLNN